MPRAVSASPSCASSQMHEVPPACKYSIARKGAFSGAMTIVGGGCGIVPRFVVQRPFRFGFFGSSRPMGGIGTRKGAGQRPGNVARSATRGYGAQKTKPKGPSRNEPPESRQKKLGVTKLPGTSVTSTKGLASLQ